MHSSQTVKAVMKCCVQGLATACAAHANCMLSKADIRTKKKVACVVGIQARFLYAFSAACHAVVCMFRTENAAACQSCSEQQCGGSGDVLAVMIMMQKAILMLQIALDPSKGGSQLVMQVQGRSASDAHDMT